MALPQYSASYGAQQFWLYDPRAVNGDAKTFVAYAEQTTGDVEIATFTHATKAWTQNDTASNTVQGVALACPTVILDSTGRLLVVFTSYTTSPSVKVIRSTNAHDASAWGSEVTIDAGASSETEFSFPTILELTSGNLVCFYRGRNSVSQPILIRQISVDNGTTWTNKQTILTFTADVNDRIDYLVRVDSTDRVHLVWDHYDNTPTVDNQDLYYAYTDNSDATTSSWFDDAAGALSLPAETPAQALIFDSSAAGWDSCYLLGMAIMPGGTPRPHIVAHARDAVTTDALLHFAWNGSTWDTATIVSDNNLGPETGIFGVEPGDGDLTIVNGTLYCASLLKVSSQSEVYEYRSFDSGATWKSGVALTESSAQHYTIPCYPQGTQSDIAHAIVFYGTTHHNAAKSIVALDSSTPYTPLRLFDRVQETSTTTGTGDIGLDGAVTNFGAASSRYADGDTVEYAIVHQTNAEHETGFGIYSGGSIARRTVLQSTNSDALVSFTAGTKDVFMSLSGASIDSSLQIAHATRSIQAAIDALPSTGGKVIVLDGTYTLSDTITLPSDVTLELRAGATILPANSYAPASAATINSKTIYTLIRNSDMTNGNDNIVITGQGRLHSEGVTGIDETVSWAGVLLNGCTNSRVENIEIDNIVYPPTVEGGSGGDERFHAVLFTECVNTVMNGIYAHHIGDDILRISRSSTNCAIRNCYAHNCSFGSGINVQSYTTTYGQVSLAANDRIEISGNTIHDTETLGQDEAGIQVHTATHSTISHNRIKTAGCGIVLMGDSTNTTIEGNIVEDSRYAGILLWGKDGSSELTDVAMNGNQINMITDTATNAVGIYLEPDDTNISRVSITGTTISGSDRDFELGIWIRCHVNSRTIEHVSISGLTCCQIGYGAVHLATDSANTGNTIQYIAVSDVVAEGCGYGLIANVGNGTIQHVAGSNIVSASTRNISDTVTGARGIRFNGCINCIATSCTSDVSGLAFSEAGAADYNLFTSCNGRGSGTTTVTIVGANSVTANNIS